MSAKLRPILDKVVVERIEAEDKTPGGIVLPDTAKDKPQQGTVIAVGPGRILDDGQRKGPDVREGEKVLFGSYAGTEVKIDGKSYLIMSESEILAVIEK